MSDRPYIRVYFNDLIRDYPEVWADDAQLATWLRLLATADPMWPTPPELPRSARPRPLDRLVKASLVTLLPAHRYRMKGMDAERTKRADAARNAAAKRWQDDGNAEGNADSNADGTAETMPKPKPSRSLAEAEPSQDAPSTARDPAVMYHTLTSKFPSGRSLEWINQLSAAFGDEATSEALATAFLDDPRVSTLLGRAQDHLRAVTRKPSKPRPLEDWQIEQRRLIQAQYDAEEPIVPAPIERPKSA